MFLGVAGGLLGAAFNKLHKTLAGSRKRVFQGRKWCQITEVVAVVLVTTLLMFCLCEYLFTNP